MSEVERDTHAIVYNFETNQSRVIEKFATAPDGFQIVAYGTGREMNTIQGLGDSNSFDPWGVGAHRRKGRKGGKNIYGRNGKPR